MNCINNKNSCLYGCQLIKVQELKGGGVVTLSTARTAPTLILLCAAASK